MGSSNQAVAPGIARPLHATGRDAKYTELLGLETSSIVRPVARI